MKPLLAQKLYSQGKVLVENPKAEPDQTLWPMARAEFLFLITALTGREAIQEALDILLKIAQGELTQSIPGNLEELVRELEKAEEERGEGRLEAMRKVRSLMVSYRLQREGVTTEIPRFTSPAPGARSASQQPPTPPRHSPTIQQALEKVVLVVTKPQLPVPTQLVHFFTSLPVRVIKATLDLGREALAKTDPNVQTFVLLWREGITSKAIKEALKSGTVAISREAVETLSTQADVLENYEKSHPVFTKLLTFYHQTEEAILRVKIPEEVKKEESKSTLEVILNTTQKTINQVRPFLSPTITRRIAGEIFNNPLTRFFASPFRAISANLLTSFKVVAIRAPVEIGRAIFPGGGTTPPIPSAIPTSHFPPPTSPTAPGLAWATGRGFPALLGRSAGIGLQGLFGVGLRAGAGLLGASAGILGGIGAVGGAVGGMAAAGVGVVASGTGVIVLIIGGAILLPIVLTLINIQGYQGAFLVSRVGAEESLYIAAAKTTPETSFKNEDMPKNVPFRITVSGKKGPLKNVRITDSFSISGAGTANLPPQSWEIPEITNPWTQAINITLPDTVKDSLVINTLTIIAEVEGQPTQKKITTTVITVGNPPNACNNINVPSGLDGDESSKIQVTCTLLGRSPKFTSLIKTQVNFVRASSERGSLEECGFVSGGSTITLYGCAFDTQEKLMYVLTHELGHVIQNFNAGVYNEFLNQINPPVGEPYIPTYPLEFSKSEDFAENIAVYITYNKFVFPKINRIFTQYPSSYPKHYLFAKDEIFGGVEYR